MKRKVKIIRTATVPMSFKFFCNGLLKELNEKYEVVALSSPGEDLDFIGQNEGVRTIAVPMERRISIFKDCKSLLQLIRVFRKEKPKMVHSMTPKAGLLCMIAAWYTKVPVRIHTFTGLVFPSTKGFTRQILMLTDKLTCCCATHVIPEGEGVKNDLKDNNITKKPLAVLGHGSVKGVDMDYFKRTSEVDSFSSSFRDGLKFTFLFVGRIVRDKGINELVDAFKKLYSEYPNTRLLLVGPFEDNYDPINLETRQTIDGYRAIQTVGVKTGLDLLALYSVSDCFVFPSYREGFPNAVLEAGAMGLPSIVTDINGSREIIVEGKNGMIVPSHDSKALYNAMKTMIDNPEFRMILSGNARSMIASRFEQGYVRQCLYDFYDKVLSSIKE